MKFIDNYVILILMHTLMKSVMVCLVVGRFPSGSTIYQVFPGDVMADKAVSPGGDVMCGAALRTAEFDRGDEGALNDDSIDDDDDDDVELCGSNGDVMPTRAAPIDVNTSDLFELFEIL